ncbi:MAG TPA: 8-amino-7-oxononanoate synthase family protein [Aquabacterium sp.]|uniref:8-amino-7-oxononanoate synthase family protein n=1 Tax=Aquabacterium sp. TaxID=1872578 RepID=UPI002E3625C0|nr:8-amino-7-oxononanoate synthase family protein [Aquabacterium sp.]HEX5372658.1 8-amino-7-oxononanoate synthase family protein [Aquabacterium sp.]
MSAVLIHEHAALDDIQVRRLMSMMSPDANGWGQGLNIPTAMRREFLSAVEQSGVNGISPRYLVFEREGRVVACANVFVSETDFATFDPKLNPDARQTLKRWFPGFMRFKVVEVGYFTMIGEGLALADERDLPQVVNCLDRELQLLMEEFDADFVLIRDVPQEKYAAYWQVLGELGYAPSTGFPNARLGVKWETLDDYLSALDSKTRLKFKNSLKLREEFSISVEVLGDYEHLADELAVLWANVNAKAKDYSREQLTAPFFKACAQHLAGRSEIIRFMHEGRMVGFMLNLVGEQDYIVLDWGVDYDFPHYREANLYRAATVLSIQRAMAWGKRSMELGITNYTPKLTLGCEIQPLTYFVRHRDQPHYSRTLARMLSDAIVQPDNTEHAAVGKVGSVTHDLPVFERSIRQDQNLYQAQDILHRVGSYQRSNTMRLGGIYGLYPEFNCAQQSLVTFSNQQEVVLLGTNSYLGLGSDERIVEAAVQALRRYGSGCSGSPLLNGTLDIHNALEHELAQFMGREAVALCSTGYQTNLAALSALCGPGDVVLMDARNHRSLFDGVKLSGADCLVFRHADLAHLDKLLHRTRGRRCMVVTDSLFSMEGTIADLVGITRLARQHGARVFVDESHAIGVFGPRGRGIAELQGVEGDVDVIMGTFSKSFAALGGFVTGRRELIDYIKHNAGGHIFSASLPPSVIATVRAALQVVIAEPERRQAVLDKAHYMATSLADMGYEVSYHGAQIVPVVFGNYTLALAAYKRFMAHGVYVNPVGPPAVPEQFAGFRTSYIATHRWEDLERALQVFRSHLPDFRPASSH